MNIEFCRVRSRGWEGILSKLAIDGSSIALIFVMWSHAAHLVNGGAERRRISTAEIRSMTHIARRTARRSGAIFATEWREQWIHAASSKQIDRCSDCGHVAASYRSCGNRHSV